MVHEVGSVLQERYEIEAPIGQGGMGAVYRARNRVTDQVVALKQLRNDTAAGFDNQEMLQRFEGEWQLLRTLNHPRIPRMLDAFRIEECGYYVMEFIEGKSLDQVLRDYKSVGKRFPEELLVQYALQILDVLHYLHSLPRPLLHRDIKPQNIIVREADSELFLVDFGLAREGGSSTTKTLVGTLGYAPLEQVKGHPEERSDLYALGASLWHMLVGEQPSPFDIPPLLTVRNDVHPALAEVIDRACQDNINRRYANATKMEMALRQALQAMTGQAPDERYEALYLAEVPEVVKQVSRPLGATEFLWRAGLASASFLLLMVVIFRFKQVVKQPQVASPTPIPLTLNSSPVGPSGPIPPPPVYEPLPEAARIQMDPAPAALATALPLRSPWMLQGFLGDIGRFRVTARAGEGGGFIASCGPPVTLRRCRLTLVRNRGPVAVQYGFFDNDRLLVGVISTLKGDVYLTSLQAGGRGSENLTRPWNFNPSQTLEVVLNFDRCELVDVEMGQKVALPISGGSVTSLQFIIPPARQEQVLDLPVLDISSS